MNHWYEWAVVIPTRNRRDLLEKALASLTEHCQDSDYEPIVVDTGDGSTYQWCAERGTRAIRLPDANLARAFNAGVASSQTLYILLMNEDVRLLADPLATMSRWLVRSGAAAIVGARLLNEGGTVVHAGVGFDHGGRAWRLWRNAPAEHPEVMKVRYLPAVSFALVGIQRATWECLSGLDEGYTNSFEDLDFCLRAREDGYPVVYDPNVVATQLNIQTVGGRNHDAEAAVRFRDAWLMSGRMSYALGVWPFGGEKGR